MGSYIAVFVLSLILIRVCHFSDIFPREGESGALRSSLIGVLLNNLWLRSHCACAVHCAEIRFGRHPNTTGRLTSTRVFKAGTQPAARGATCGPLVLAVRPSEASGRQWELRFVIEAVITGSCMRRPQFPTT